MRARSTSWLTSLAAMALCFVTASCGEAHRDTSRPTSAGVSSVPPGGYLRDDGDSDDDDGVHKGKNSDKTDILFPLLEKPADKADREAISALVKRYYRAAAAGDGTTACAQLDSTLASGLSAAGGGSGESGGSPCATLVSTLFKQQHVTTANTATMVVTDVRIKRGIGWALVGFRAAPVGIVHVKRAGTGWKMNALLDTGMS